MPSTDKDLNPDFVNKYVRGTGFTNPLEPEPITSFRCRRSKTYDLS